MANLPEELLERILEQTIPAPRPHWLRSPHSTLTRLAPLSVSRQFHRVATPLLYHTIHLTSPHTASLLLETLHAHPEYAQHIRALTVLGIWRPVVDVLRLCGGHLSTLDLTIAFDEESDHANANADPDLDVDLEVFAQLTTIRHLTLRKAPSVYLSLARPRALITALAHAITFWAHLRTANIAFKLSDDTPTSPIASSSPFAPFSPFALPPSPSPAPAQPQPQPHPHPNGPITALATALAASPALHTFSTHLPSVWNASIATIASNPALERICLSPASATCASQANCPASAASPAIPGTGLFLMQARRHPRLAELIGAGTPIIRSRAHTLGTRVPPAPSSCASSSSSTTTTAPPTKPPTGLGIGLGLRIDTSEEAIHGPSGSGGGIVYRSPTACLSPIASPSASVSAINPAWMGPVRRASTRGKRRRG